MGASVIVRMINQNGQMTKYMVSTDGLISNVHGMKNF